MATKEGLAFQLSQATSTIIYQARALEKQSEHIETLQKEKENLEYKISRFNYRFSRSRRLLAELREAVLKLKLVENKKLSEEEEIERAQTEKELHELLNGLSTDNETERNRMEIKKLDKYIKNVQRFEVVKSVKEWEWQSRYPDFETAVNALLKQLDLQRELLLIAAIQQRRLLIKTNKNKSN